MLSKSRARKQLSSSDTILDLTSIAATGITLTLLISTDCALRNQFGFVKLDPLTGSTYQVNGVSQDNASFRDAIRSQFINPYQQTGGSSHKFGQTLQSISWNLASSQSGYYAPVMITQAGEVFTFGATTARDGRQAIRIGLVAASQVSDTDLKKFLKQIWSV